MSQIATLKSNLAGHIRRAHNITCVNSVAFHPTESLLATGSDDYTAKLWRFKPDGLEATCVATLEGHSKFIKSVAFNPIGTILATGSFDKTVKLWSFSPDGSVANNMSAICVATLEGHKQYVNSIAFNAIGTILATGSADYTAKLWQMSPDRMAAICVATLEGHRGSVLSVAFHPTEPLLATGAYDKKVKLWSFSPDGSVANNMLATCMATLNVRSGLVSSVAFNPKGTILATGSSATYNIAKLWQLSPDRMAANCVATLQGHNYSVLSVVFHPTEPLLATGSGDNTAKLWRFSPNSSAANNMSAICVGTLKGHHFGVSSVAFNPKGTILATGSDDNTAKLWELNLDSANFNTLILSRNEDSIIINIPPHLLKSSNNSCASFKRLYNQIMRISLDEKFRFKFEGQAGYDVVGLTRSIFDKVLPVYTNKFFDTIEINNEFLILKKDISNEIFEHETNQLILLSDRANTIIFLKIDPRLLDLLLSQDLKKYFSNNKKNFEKFYKNVNNSIQNNSYDVLNSISNSLFLRINKNNNNKNTVINRYKKTQEQEKEIKNMLLREIRLRRFLAECGFSSWEQVQNMQLFIQKFWDPEKFSSELKFDIESFSKKLKIIKENSYDDKIKIPLDKFVKLSTNNSMQFDFNNLNSNISNIYADYKLFRPFLNYILGPESTDEIRKLFVNYVAGTIYYPGKLKLVLSHQFAPYPFKSETCFNKLKFFKSNPQDPQFQINNVTKFIEKEIKPNKDSVNFGLV